MQRPPFAFKQIQMLSEKSTCVEFYGFITGKSLYRLSYHAALSLNLKERLQGFPLYNITSHTSPANAENALVNNSLTFIHCLKRKNAYYWCTAERCLNIMYAPTMTTQSL